MPKTTVFRFLKALTDNNYLKYEPYRKQYSLGPRVLLLGFTVLQNMEAREIARPYLESLSREFNRSTSFLIRDKTEMVYVERIRVPALRDFNISIGSRISVHNTAAGRSVLAYMEEDKLKDIVGQLALDSGISRSIGKNGSKLLQLLTRVRKQGYAINDQESVRGVRAIAVPVFSAADSDYAISLVVPPEEVAVEELRTRYAPILTELGRELSEALGHTD